MTGFGAMGFGWKVHIDDDWARDARRLLVYRTIGEGVEVIVDYDETGTPVVQRYDPGVTPEFRGFVLPEEVYERIAELVKPGPSTAELGRLEDALAVERQRVDKVLSWAMAIDEGRADV